ncbi:hypothetical protein FGO68_gene17156 [Halteria grandinella]|uniref:Uncharacterized protein n=1 Tax=Halteria grandinella TaxID=5974 RepID=A0A8J8NU41_HALGN|nr:hypothetical protein FGO68_gene17156 [Halteria grandinella]
MKQQEQIYFEEYRQVKSQLQRVEKNETLGASPTRQIKSQMLDAQIKESLKLQEDVRTRIKFNDVRLLAKSKTESEKHKVLDLETVKLQALKSLLQDLDLTIQKQLRLTTQLERMTQSTLSYQDSLTLVSQKTDKYIWLGKKYGLNFEDAEQAREILEREYCKEVVLASEFQMGIVRDARRAMERKYRAEMNEIGKKKRELVEALDQRQRELKKMDMKLNKRVQDYTLLRMEFEFKRNPPNMTQYLEVSEDSHIVHYSDQREGHDQSNVFLTNLTDL